MFFFFFGGGGGGLGERFRLFGFRLGFCVTGLGLRFWQSIAVGFTVVWCLGFYVEVHGTYNYSCTYNCTYKPLRCPNMVISIVICTGIIGEEVP